jgi:acetylornithine deacetylase/succinyl-diaminopimelate desuccinylase-like protein
VCNEIGRAATPDGVVMTEMSQSLRPVLDRVDADFEAALERWKAFLRIPSVSTDPAYNDKTREAAAWLAAQLEELGFRAELRDTPGHPMVVAHHDGPGAERDAPRLLYYGHYDVQPPDPVELWHTGPFEPTIVEAERGRRMVARGAVDDKGQLLTFLEAFRAWQAVHGTLPVKVTAFFEGEEESGSPSLVPFLKENARELAADVAVVSDTGSWDVDTPALTTRLRGMVYTELTVTGPGHDLHSGLYGGVAPNPANALARVIGGLHDARGRIAIPGFYDDVVEPDADTKAQWDALNPDAAALQAELGVDALSGESDRGLLERMWSRPTCDVNGIIGGYTGAGTKTVIASQASAKISFRLVPDQDPERLVAAFRQYVADTLPAGCRFDLTVHNASPAIRVPTDNPYLDAARHALADVYGKPPVLIGSGGSIPVVGEFKSLLGIDTLLMGFGLDDDRMHSPNEKFELACFENGIKSHCALLDRIQALAARRNAAE